MFKIKLEVPEVSWLRAIACIEELVAKFKGEHVNLEDEKHVVVNIVKEKVK